MSLEEFKQVTIDVLKNHPLAEYTNRCASVRIVGKPTKHQGLCAFGLNVPNRTRCIENDEGFEAYMKIRVRKTNRRWDKSRLSKNARDGSIVISSISALFLKIGLSSTWNLL